MSETPDEPTPRRDDPAGDDPERAALETALGGRYQVVRRLGRGAFGAVYLAREPLLHRLVAVKVLRLEHAGDAVERERFRREARTGAQLVHPGIVPLLTYGEATSDAGPLLYMVMPYVPGESLAVRLTRHGTLSSDEVRRLLADLALGLEFAHRQGVVHRDIKPENVLLSSDGATTRALLADFGVAAFPNRDPGVGARREALGSPPFMSPEQRLAEADVDGRSDVYALGALGFLMLAGRGHTPGADAAAGLAAAAPGAHPDLVRTIARCLELDPAHRWQRASAVRSALLQGSLTGGPRRPRRTRPTVPAAAAAAAAPGNARSRAAARFPGGFVGTVLDDLRVALRGLRRAPGFTAASILTLALGIGANAAIFSVIDAVLLRPLPYARPERVVRVYETMNAGSGIGSVAVPTFRDWRAQSRSFSHLAALDQTNVAVRGTGESERLGAVAATDDFFALLGVGPALGRTFLPGEDRAGQPRVAVLSDELWHRRFGGDSSAVGRTLVLDDVPHTVVGVMPPGFRYPAGGRGAELFVPLTPSAEREARRESHSLTVIGRLAPGTDVEAANADLAAVTARIAEQHPTQMAGRGARVVPMRETMVARVRPALLVLLGAVGLVLLIACANVASLTLARAASRRREVAIRSALGATRGRLGRQFLTESVLLALLGAAVGTLCARWSFAALAALAASELPLGGGLALNATVLAYLLGLALLTGVGFGLVPALQASSPDLRGDLSDAAGGVSSGRSQHRVRSALVVAQIAISLVLLVGSGLLLRAFLALRGVDVGFAIENVLTAHVAVPAAGAADAAGAAAAGGPTSRFLRPALERARAIPGVRAAAATSLLPIQSAYTNADFTIDGEPTPPPGHKPLAEFRVASPGLFAALGVPLRAGRDLAEDDDVRRRVIVVNEEFVRRYLPKGSPLGRVVRGMFTDETHTIVGVVGDVRQAGLDMKPLPEVYIPYGELDSASLAPEMVLVLRTAVPPATIAPALRRAVQRVDAGRPLYSVLTMEQVIGDWLAGRRLYLWLLGSFGAVALALASAGIYGVVAYVVTQRRREVGIRMALGARGTDVVRLMLRQGIALTAAGVALGVLGALALTRLLASLLYGVGTTDVITYVAVVAILGGVALVATWIPARRAARVDPLITMRAE